MILPIVGLGCNVLRQKAEPITPDYPELKQFLADMYETMYAAEGVGLAAPQVDRSVRVVVIGFPVYDPTTKTYSDKNEEHTLINPEILAVSEEKAYFNEGCLSVPDIHEDVMRPTTIKLKYFDEDFNEHVETITGMFARVAQHEIDHLDGIVFTDRLSPLRKTLIKRKINDVVSGKVRTHYRMKNAKR